MKHLSLIFYGKIKRLLVTVSLLFPFMANGQQNIIVNLGAIDGLPLTPENIFNYQVQSSGTGKVQINGSIRYRNSGMSITYSFLFTLRQGINQIAADEIHPQWQFSSPALQELFFTYKVLPEGTFEYCVTVTPSNAIKESTTGLFEECLYYRSDDIFLINLIVPVDKDKLIEYNPLLTWIANYSFSNELTYRVRVAEIKQGQNPANAIMLNQPVYDENNLMQNSIMYPLYAKPLVANQWYAWTVDAYYKGILLGGAETWQFIIPDTIPVPDMANMSYIDIAREKGTNYLYAIGAMKLKYVLEDKMNDSLSLELLDKQSKKCQFSPNTLGAKYGDNRYILNFDDKANLKHKSNYTLVIKTKTNHEFRLPFQYFKPGYSR